MKTSFTLITFQQTTIIWTSADEGKYLETSCCIALESEHNKMVCLSNQADGQGFFDHIAQLRSMMSDFFF